jgi:hypothetical protein
MEMTLKQRFLHAIVQGEIGDINELGGAVVSLREFRRYFHDIDFNYAGSFLPGAVIETGQMSATHTRFVFRIGRGKYMVHPDAIEEYRCSLNAEGTAVE